MDLFVTVLNSFSLYLCRVKQGNSAAYMIPTTRKEMEDLGWKQADIILFTGDAFVDHPAFGVAVLARMLQSDGFKVAVVPQPNWRDDLRDFKKMGAPKYFFGVSAGNMDSMVNHYTANRRLRSDDAYTPGGRAGQRPDYPTIVYTKALKNLFPDSPVIIGGIEASMRRFTHYDYWKNQLLPGILQQSKADLLMYGMSEYILLYAAQYLRKQEPFEMLYTLPQVQYLTAVKPDGEVQLLHSHEDCLASKEKFAENFVHFERAANLYDGMKLAQQVGEEWLVANAHSTPLTEKKIDKVYNLPYTRKPHPKYHHKDEIPAYNMICHSVNIHRGCFGGCAFCTIAAHQGKWIASRSEKSVLKELEKITQMDDFKGHITDIGGPSANMYKMSGKDLNICKRCKRPSCIFPNVCKNLNTDHTAMVNLYGKARNKYNIKRISIGSGVRYDLIQHAHPENRAAAETYLEDLVRYHVSGRLKVAPEHTQDKVLNIMRKPGFGLFVDLKKRFDQINKKYGMNQQLIPYFISSHPGCEVKDMVHLAAESRKHDLITDQVQDFTPTPMTLATVMYYSGIDPYSHEKVYVAKDREAKLAQRKYFFTKDRKNHEAIKKDLQKLGLSDLERALLSYKNPNPTFSGKKDINKKNRKKFRK